MWKSLGSRLLKHTELFLSGKTLVDPLFLPKHISWKLEMFAVPIRLTPASVSLVHGCIVSASISPFEDELAAQQLQQAAHLRADPCGDASRILVVTCFRASWPRFVNHGRGAKNSPTAPLCTHLDFSQTITFWCCLVATVSHATTRLRSFGT